MPGLSGEDRLFVTVRGTMPAPTVLEVSLTEAEVVRAQEICRLSPNAPPKKQGTTGIDWFEGVLAVASWDAIHFLDPESLREEQRIDDRRLSDLHSLHVGTDGKLWVANSNLDSILTIDRDLRIQEFWHPDDRGPEDPSTDYRRMTKDEIGLGRYHINAAVRRGDRVIASFLGKIRQPSLADKVRWKLGRRRRKLFTGGAFVLAADGRLLRRYDWEGTHDTLLDDEGSVWFTVFGGSAVLRYDTYDSVTPVPLEFGFPAETGYLTRGLAVFDSTLWVGHTVRRGAPNPTALLRNYSLDGSWKGVQIALAGYQGVYGLVQGSTPRSKSAPPR